MKNLAKIQPSFVRNFRLSSVINCRAFQLMVVGSLPRNFFFFYFKS